MPIALYVLCLVSVSGMISGALWLLHTPDAFPYLMAVLIGFAVAELIREFIRY